MFDCTVPNNTLSRAELSYDEGTVLNVHYGDVLIKYGSVLDVQKDDIPRIPHRCREDFNGALLQDGDIIIADTAEDETTGKACEISNLQGSVIVSGLHTMVCRPRNRMALGYLGYYLNSNAYHHQLLPLMQGIKVLSLSRSNIQKTSVSYPTAVKEQQHIAYYFSQLDNLITLHQRQPFLHSTPDISLSVRLIHPFYTSSWEQRKAIDIADYSKGNGYSKGDLTDAGNPIILYGRLYTKYQFAISEVDTFAVPRNGAVYSQGNEVIVPASGETAEDIARASAVEKSGVLLGGDLNILRPFGFINPLFLALAISNGEPQKELAKKAQGKSVVHIHNTDIQEVTIAYPSKTEQDRIVSVFRQLDNLITLHQRKFEKLTNVKKSMLEKMFPQNGSSYPEIRFKGFTDPWEQRKFSDITFPAGEKNKDNLPLESYSITNEHGFVPQDEKFENGGTMREADKRMYYIVSPNSFAYNPARINVGSIGYQNIGKNVIVSSLYEVFKTSEDVDDRLLWHWFKSPDFQKLIMQLQEGGVRLYFYYDKLCMGEVSLPSLEEQRKIGKLFDTLDNLITLHQRELEKLQNIKKSMLEKMFV